MVKKNAEFLLEELQLQKMKRGDFVPHSVQSLQRDLRLAVPPRRIECFDISNIQGSDTVAALVVFVDAKARKSEYRKFKIRSVLGPDDFASMREVVERRYTRLTEEGGTAPDLIMVDGGKGQLSSAVEGTPKTWNELNACYRPGEKTRRSVSADGERSHNNPPNVIEFEIASADP